MSTIHRSWELPGLRSAADTVEAYQVFIHPRCINYYPTGGASSTFNVLWLPF